MVGEEEFQPKFIQVGKGLINATSIEFINGFQAGHLEYVNTARHQTEPFTDTYMTELFFEKLEDIKLPSLFGMGFVAGWLHSLATRGGTTI
jgi:hypothetical protein